jgi:hypothetical protein
LYTNARLLVVVKRFSVERINNHAIDNVVVADDSDVNLGIWVTCISMLKGIFDRGDEN